MTNVADLVMYQHDSHENMKEFVMTSSHITYLDNDYAAAVVVAVPMVDDDNEPAPENCPVANETVGDIFSGWLHSGICEHRSTVHQDSQPELKFRMSSETEPTNLYLFEVLYEGKVFTSSARINN